MDHFMRDSGMQAKSKDSALWIMGNTAAFMLKLKLQNQKSLKKSNFTLFIFIRNGDFYKGEWLKDKKHGKGFYKWENGNTYKGDWRNDKMNGKGIFVTKIG